MNIHSALMYSYLVYLTIFSYILTHEYGMPVLFDFNSLRIGETYLPIRYLYDWI
jgi:hypothetical protein